MICIKRLTRPPDGTSTRTTQLLTSKARPLALSGDFPCFIAAKDPTTNYIGIAGIGKDAPILPKGDPRCGVFGFDRRTTLADITDGAANTLMIVESGRATGSWLQGGFATVRGLDPANTPYLGPNRQFGGLHQGGAWIATADGSVRWVRDSIDPRVFEALSTIAGGEKVARSDDAFRE